MGDGVSFKLDGDKELARQLKRLGDDSAIKVIKPAATQAYTPMLSALRKAVQTTPFIDSEGALANALKKKVVAYKQKGVVVAVVGPDRNYSQPSDNKYGKRRPGNYLHLIEYGFMHASGVFVRGYGIFRNTYDTTRAKAAQKFIDVARRQVVKLAKKK